MSEVPVTRGHDRGRTALIRPRFFRGQLLTDRDFECLIRWVGDQRRLVGVAAGWGVVRGMQLRLDSESPMGIVVEPGQAIDREGLDLVLEDARSMPLPVTEGQGKCADPAAERARSGCLAIDVAVRRIEIPEEPQSGLHVDGARPPIEFSRVRSSCEVVCTPCEDVEVRPDSAPPWHGAYLRATKERLAGYLGRNRSLKPLFAEVKYFAFLRDEKTREALPEAVRQFYLDFDLRLEFLRGPRVDRDADCLVPVGRVWIERETQSIVAIDQRPEYRRSFDPQTDEAGGGRVSLAPFVGATMESLVGELARVGLSVATRSELDAELSPSLEGEVLQVPVGSAVHVVYLDAGLLGRLVVGFQEHPGSNDDLGERRARWRPPICRERGVDLPPAGGDSVGDSGAGATSPVS